MTSGTHAGAQGHSSHHAGPGPSSLHYETTDAAIRHTRMDAKDRTHARTGREKKCNFESGQVHHPSAGRISHCPYVRTAQHSTAQHSTAHIHTHTGHTRVRLLFSSVGTHSSYIRYWQCKNVHVCSKRRSKKRRRQPYRNTTRGIIYSGRRRPARLTRIPGTQSCCLSMRPERCTSFAHDKANQETSAEPRNAERSGQMRGGRRRGTKKGNRITKKRYPNVPLNPIKSVS
jgi:hypothetical protein